MTAWLLNTSTGRNILAIGAALVAVLAVIGGLMRAGAVRERQAAQNRTQREIIKGHEVRNEVDNAVSRLPDALGQLMRDWTRP